jgi:ATP synthase protein I
MTDKLKDMRTKIEAIKSKEKKEIDKNNNKQESQQNMRVGLQAGAELITATVAGAAIGYWLDQWFETKPIFLIALLILGVITGFTNVWRTTQNIGYKVGYKDQIDNKKDRRQ